MRLILTAAAVAALSISSASALTLKSGQVLGSDGQVYDGASPETRDNIVASAQARGENAGVTGNNVFVVVGETVTFVPVDQIRGKSDEQVIEIVGDAVIQNVTGNEDITFADLQAAQEVAENTGVELEALAMDGLEGLDEELVKEIEAFSAESGIQVENLVALNTIIESLPTEEIDSFVEEIGALVEEGFADEVDAFLTELQEIEGGLDAITNFDSYESCVNGGGGAVCDQVDALYDKYEGDDEGPETD